MKRILALAGAFLAAYAQRNPQAESRVQDRRKQIPLDKSRTTPLGALKALMAEHGMTASDLGRLLGNRTPGAAILSGWRALSKAHVTKLAVRFKVEPGPFLSPPNCEVMPMRVLQKPGPIKSARK